MFCRKKMEPLYQLSYIGTVTIISYLAEMDYFFLIGGMGFCSGMSFVEVLRRWRSF